MATKPTRAQQQAGDLLAHALALTAEARRLDGGGRLDQVGFRDAATRIAEASSAFDLDELVSRALARRTRDLGLRSDAVELLTLLETEVAPLDALHIPDEELRGLVARLEEELGDV